MYKTVLQAKAVCTGKSTLTKLNFNTCVNLSSYSRMGQSCLTLFMDIHRGVLTVET